VVAAREAEEVRLRAEEARLHTVVAAREAEVADLREVTDQRRPGRADRSGARRRGGGRSEAVQLAGRGCAFA
jgi:hypothetical protein